VVSLPAAEQATPGRPYQAPAIEACFVMATDFSKHAADLEMRRNASRLAAIS
jgi:hypothetical protein